MQAPVAVAPRSVRKAPPVAASAPASQASATPEGRIYAQSELPDEIKRELPALAVGGSIYSRTPSGRLLIVSGQLFHEGDKLAPELTLEQINLKSAVLRYKSYRYTITY